MMFIFASSRESMQPQEHRRQQQQQQQTSTSNPSSRRASGNHRYTRSSTTSVTQLLSDSCSNLLQRLTNRVRGPSSSNERPVYTSAIPERPNHLATIHSPARHRHAPHHEYPRTRHQQPLQPLQTHRRQREDPLSSTASARSRLEEKYYPGLLDRSQLPSYQSLATSRTNLEGRRPREPSPYARDMREERTLEPSVSRSSIVRCPASSSNIVLSEKAYPYVGSSTVRRDKTPGAHERRTHHPRRNAEGRASGYDTVSPVNRHSG